MIIVTSISLGFLAAAGLLCAVRLIRRGTLAERFVALSILVIVLVGGIAVRSVQTESGAFLDVVVVATLLDFVSASTIARFIERRGV